MPIFSYEDKFDSDCKNFESAYDENDNPKILNHITESPQLWFVGEIVIERGEPAILGNISSFEIHKDKDGEIITNPPDQTIHPDRYQYIFTSKQELLDWLETKRLHMIESAYEELSRRVNLVEKEKNIIQAMDDKSPPKEKIFKKSQRYEWSI